MSLETERNVRQDRSGVDMLAGFAMNTALLRQMEMLLQAQCTMLERMEPVMTGWLQRRREGASAAVVACHRMAEAPDPKAAIDVLQDWMSSQSARLNADLNAWRDAASDISGSTFQALRTATAEKAEKAAAAATAAAEGSAAPRGPRQVAS